MSKQVSTGNIVHFLTGCFCGRGWETEKPLDRIPDHVHNHRLDSDVGVHTCTGCLWAVFTFTDELNPEGTKEAVDRAFAKHLLTTALEATA